MSDIAFSPAVELAAAVRSQQIGSRELLEHYLKRVERFNPRLNAIVQLNAERARARAAAADEATVRGESWGPLHGLPMTIKELFEVEGYCWTAGDPKFAERVAAVNSPAVQRLVEAGAVVFGVTNSPLNGLDVQTYNDVYGTTNNPRDLARSPGGSSGGAAAALAAGLCALELGSDIGGSIRTPAHLCGIYGHKPSYGIVPRRRLAPPGPLTVSDLSVAGPMARSADDLDFELSIIAGPDWDQAKAWRLELPPPRRQALRDYRVAAWLDDPSFPVDAPVREPLVAAVAALRKEGVQVDETARPQIGGLGEVFRVYHSLLDAATTRIIDPPGEGFARLAAAEDALEPETPSGGEDRPRNPAMRHRTWKVLEERRQQMRAAWAEFFGRFDVLLAPVAQVTAILHDHSDQDGRLIRVNGEERPYTDWLSWAGLVTMAYLPSTAAPVGRAANGLPVGVQIVGPYLEDRTTIDFARRLADVIGGFEPPPGFE